MRASHGNRKRKNRLGPRAVRANRKEVDRKFQFLITPITTNVVDVSVLTDLAALVASRSQGYGFENALAGVVLFPIVANPDIYVRPDFVVHKRSDRAFYVGKNIDFATWLRARKSGRLKLAVENFENSLLAIPEKHFPMEAKARLRAIVRVAAEQME